MGLRGNVHVGATSLYNGDLPISGAMLLFFSVSSSSSSINGFCSVQ